MKFSLNSKIFSFIFLISCVVHSQDLSTLKNTDINSLSDDQISSYWSSIKKNGYTMSQVENLAKTQGIPYSKVAEFKRRVYSLDHINKAEDIIVKTKSIKNITSEPYGIRNGQVVQNKVNGLQLFGFNFFNNSKITFTPNVNISVPDNYQIGPGDEMMIDLWGASEVTYNPTVSKTGNIKINGIGFIYVNGFTLKEASKKIISKLKRKHAGIGASKNSYERINTKVTVSKIRTVQVNIIGEVKVPGTYSLNSLSTVLNALYMAGGPTKLGSFRKIKLVRNNKTIATLDVYEYLINGKQKGNLKLQDQDVLLIGPYNNLITVEGAVKRPGIYELNNSQTLADLICYFGGFTSKAYSDLLVLERFDGAQKEVKEVALKDASTFKMQSGDRILVQEVLDIYKNKVSIEGEVFRPGNFELTKKMSLKDLILKSEGITPEAFLNRGILIRSYDNTKLENIPFSIPEILNGTEDIILQKNDKIKIFNKKDLREKRTITINGAVNNPQTIDYVEKMQIEDLIALSGGLKEGAAHDMINVSRRLNDGSFKTLSQVFSLSSIKNLKLNNDKPFYLEPFDQITVRYSKGFTKQQFVRVIGEVSYPGPYAITTKEFRISDLIKQSGGLTNFAYPLGATLKRKAGYLTKDLSAFSKLGSENFSLISQSKNEYVVAIDLVGILQNSKTDVDLLLRPGDVITIPEIMQTVQVVGEVYVPSLVQYKKNKSLKYYISSSGGFTDKAKTKKIAVQYSNGEIKTVKNFLFFKSFPKIIPGSKILVPIKPEKEKLSTQEVLGITSSIATLALIVQTLAN